MITRRNVALGATVLVESEHAFERVAADQEPKWARFIDDTHFSGRSVEPKPAAPTSKNLETDLHATHRAVNLSTMVQP